jgi:hypothetical protein
MLPFREAQLLHKIATKIPPISAEDAAAVGGAGDVDKVSTLEFSILAYSWLSGRADCGASPRVFW